VIAPDKGAEGEKGMEPKSSEGPQTEGDVLGKTPGRKAKPTVQLDLPPESIKKVDLPSETPEEAADAAPSVPVEKRKSSPIGLVAAIGLVAGLVGGAGGSQIINSFDTRVTTLANGLDQRLVRLESARPSVIPPEWNERLQRAETLARGDIEKLRTELQGEQAERSRAVAALGERLSAGAASSAAILTPGQDVVPELERFKTRLEALENALRPLPENLAAVAQRQSATSARLDAFTPRLEELAKVVDGVKPEVGALTERMTGLSRGLSGISVRDDLTRASARLVAVTLASEALARSEAFGPVVVALRGLGADTAALAPLAAFTTEAPLSLAALAADLRKAAMRSEPTEKSAGGDLIERLKAGASSLVDIRRTGEITGTDDSAHIGRAEQAIQRGDLATAVTLLARLTPQRAPAFQELKQKVVARLGATEALARLRRESLDQLTQAATAR
jgi:hypothetical protein